MFSKPELSALNETVGCRIYYMLFFLPCKIKRMNENSSKTDDSMLLYDGAYCKVFRQ